MGLRDIFIRENNCQRAWRRIFNWRVWRHTDAWPFLLAMPMLPSGLNSPFFLLKFSASRDLSCRHETQTAWACPAPSFLPVCTVQEPSSPRLLHPPGSTCWFVASYSMAKASTHLPYPNPSTLLVPHSSASGLHRVSPGTQTCQKPRCNQQQQQSLGDKSQTNATIRTRASQALPPCDEQQETPGGGRRSLGGVGARKAIPQSLAGTC